MGCWNETCAFSHFPIFSGTKVLAIPTCESPFRRRAPGMHYCYPTDRYQPFMPPIIGEYNGYGSVENCVAPPMVWIETVQKLFAAGLLVTKDGNCAPQSPEDFLSNIERGHITARHNSLGKSQELAVSYVLVHYDLYKKLLTTDRQCTGNDASCVFASIASKATSNNESLGVIAGEAAREAIHDFGYFFSSDGLINSCLRASIQSFVSNSDVSAGKKGFGTLAQLNSIFSGLRKTWEPVSGAGSQAVITEEMKVLATWMVRPRQKYMYE